ncbi:MAG: hypothetical protein ACTS5I_09910 [Rhodanobacter sp.]
MPVIWERDIKYRFFPIPSTQREQVTLATSEDRRQAMTWTLKIEVFGKSDQLSKNKVKLSTSDGCAAAIDEQPPLSTLLFRIL